MTTIHPEENSYFLDQESSAEMARLIDQDAMVSRHMGGLFPGGLDLARVRDILDIGCGPGGWVLEAAFAAPEKRVVGIDISTKMLTYARARAEVQALKNAHFQFMDATEPLKFPDASFDFINARFLAGFMWKGAWEPLARECFRISRPGGVIRLTEIDGPGGVTTSKALERLSRLVAQAFQRQGRTFCDDPDTSHFGLTPMLRGFLEQAGFREVVEQPHMLNYSYGREGYTSQWKNLQFGMKLVQPFLIKTGVASQKELDTLYDQMLLEMMQENFHGIWYFMSAIGRKPLTP